MAAHDCGSLAHRPHFFKFLFPTPSLNLRIPPEFHTHLQSGFPKTAILFCPHAKIWDIEVHQANSDIFFQRGWPEFVKAHDLRTGYLLLFQYNGHMNFEVKVFDTTSCLKDYSLKDCTPVVPHYTEIEDSSGSENLIHSNKSDDETQSLPSSLGARHSVHISSTCKRPAYIEIEDTSESEGQSTNEVSDEIPNNYLSKRRKLSNSSCRVQEIQTNVEGKKTLTTTPNSTCCDKFETILSRHRVESYEFNLPKAFCVKNGLVTSRSIFLIGKSEEEGKVVPDKWPVQLYCTPPHFKIQKGWRRFCKQNCLKIGYKCIFHLVSKDTFLVETVPTKHAKLKLNYEFARWHCPIFVSFVCHFIAFCFFFLLG